MYRCLFVIAAVGLSLGCSHDGKQPAEESPAGERPAEADQKPAARLEKLAAVHLPNPVRVHPRVISGGLPEGDAAFRELQSLGIKTIISVDGAKPDVALAKKYGLRYVHLPHGYDGIPRDCAKQLAKAVRDLEGPVYIHCHHGKHRSPAAASVACVGAGLLQPADAVAVLKLAGTSENYRGLYQSAESAQPLEAAMLDALTAEFPETAELPPLAEAMVAIEHTHDNLKAIAAAGWRAPKEHPDLEPAHEALLLREHFTELLRSADVQREPAAFRRFIRRSQAKAEELEAGLRAWKLAGSPASPPKRFGLALAAVTNDCKACHRRFRDIPLSEKSAK